MPEDDATSPDLSGECRRLPHPRALAFLGDAVFELHVRQVAVAKGLSHSDELHRFTTARVNATRQSELLHHLKPHLTEPELDIIRQARNQAVGSSRRNDQNIYRQATGLEALMGALSLTDPTRLDALWAILDPLLQADEQASGKLVEAEPADSSE